MMIKIPFTSIIIDITTANYPNKNMAKVNAVKPYYYHMNKTSAKVNAVKYYYYHMNKIGKVISLKEAKEYVDKIEKELLK